jgi:hypothetical protein
MVFVADSIPEELQRIVEFLNEQMKQVDVLAVEVKQYVGQGLRTLVPRVFGMTAEAQLKKRQAPSSSIDEVGLLAQMPADYARAIKTMFDTLRAGGLKVFWGVVGCSIQTSALGRRAPLSIGWVNPPGRSGWSGLTDVTLGVDRASVQEISPHLLDDVDWYVEQVALLPGAGPVRWIAGSSFRAPDVVAQQDGIISLMLAFAERLKRDRGYAL